MKAFWLLLIVSSAMPQHYTILDCNLRKAAPVIQISTEKPVTNAKLIFRGNPQGGELKLRVKGRTFEARTNQNEDLEHIAADFAAMINADRAMKEQEINAKAHGPELNIHVNEVWVFFCAADKGLVVPAPPTDLRVEKQTDDTFHLSWKIPPGGYDRINILRGSVPIADGISGDNTSFADYALGESPIYTVFGIKNNMPSCAATQ